MVRHFSDRNVERTSHEPLSIHRRHVGPELGVALGKACVTLKRSGRRIRDREEADCAGRLTKWFQWVDLVLPATSCEMAASCDRGSYM